MENENKQEKMNSGVALLYDKPDLNGAEESLKSCIC